MPGIQDHIELAELNKELGDKINALEFRFQSWAIVAFHYSALHWVDAYLAEAWGRHPKSHIKREQFLMNDGYLKGELSTAYKRLEDLSREVRYNGLSPEAEEIDEVKTAVEFIKNQISAELTKRQKKKQAQKTKKVRGK